MAKKLLNIDLDEAAKKEIWYNIINSLLAGGLVFLGAFTTGGVTFKGVCLAVVTSLIVALTKFKEYWDGEAGEYSQKLLQFVSF